MLFGYTFLSFIFGSTFKTKPSQILTVWITAEYNAKTNIFSGKICFIKITISILLTWLFALNKGLLIWQHFNEEYGF